MAGKAIGYQVDIHFKYHFRYHFKYGPEPTGKGVLPAQDMSYVVDLVTAGWRICGQVAHFGLFLPVGNEGIIVGSRVWRDDFSV